MWFYISLALLLIISLPIYPYAINAQIDFQLENKIIPPTSNGSLPLINSAIYKSSHTNSYIFGEVLNNNSYPVSFVKVYTSVYDDANNVIASSSGHVRDYYLAPGQKSGFWILIEQDVPRGSNYSLTSTFEESKVKPEFLKLDVILLSLNPVLIEGTVTNLGIATVSNVQVSAIYYDQNGIVVDSDYDAIIQDIGPLEKANFSLKPILNYDNKDLIKSVALNAESLEYSMIGNKNTTNLS